MTRETPNYDRQFERSLKIEELSTEFELNWSSDRRKQIEQYVETNSIELSEDIVRELTSVECELRMRNGESPRADEYLNRFPAYAKEISEAFEFHRELQLESDSGANDVEAELPSHIGDYRIVRKIGHGGMGIVYEAIQESLDRKVAIKTLNDHPLNVPRKATRFGREARAVAKLHHNNIVNLFGSGVHNGIPYFAMHLIEGQSLDELLIQAKTNPKFPNQLLGPKRFENIAKIGIQIANALQYAHEQGILHRDIKPSNLIIDKSNKTWVSDFGLAKLTAESDATNSVDVVGTLRYLPPEAVNGVWEPTSDIYSLGLTLYELLALRPAYPQTDRIVLLNRKSSGIHPKRIAAAGIKVPADLENIVSKAIEHKPIDRYLNAGQFAEDLSRFVEGESTLARPDGPIIRVAKWSRRRKALAALMSTILAVAILGIPSLTYMWLRSENALNQLKTEQIRTTVARGLERSALATAEKVSREAEAAIYGSSILLAQRYLRDGNVKEAERILIDWLPKTNEPIVDHRGWEWFYLHEQLDDSLLTLRSEFEYVWSAVFSPDDSRIATVHGPDPFQLRSNAFGQCAAILWDAETGRRICEFKDPDSNIYSVAFSPDNKELATLGIDFDETNGIRAKLIVWDRESGRQLRSRKLPGSYDRFLLVERTYRPNLPVVRYSRDGRDLITSPDPIESFDAETLESLVKIENGSEFAETSNGDLVFAKRKQPGLHRYDRKTGQSERLFPTDAKMPQDLVISHEKNLVSMVVNRNFQIRDLSTGAIQMESAPGSSYLACVSPCGKTHFFSKRSGVLHQKYFSMPDLDVKRFGHKNSLTSLAFNSDSTRLVTSSLDGTAKVWEIGIGCGNRIVDVYQTKITGSTISEIEFVEDENVVYASRSRLPENSETPSSGSVGPNGIFQVNLHTTFYANWPRTDFDFSPNGKLLAAPVLESHLPKSALNFSKSDCIGIWSTESWRRLQAINVAMAEIRSVAWSANNRYLAAAGVENGQPIVQIYERNKDEQGLWLDQLNEYPIAEFNTKLAYCMAFRDNKIALGCDDGIEVWSLEFPNDADSSTCTIGPKKTITLDGIVRYLDFSPDCKRLAAAQKEKSTVAVVDLESSELVYEKPGPQDICCVKYSPNGRRLALSGYEGIVFLCDSEMGNRLLALKSCQESPGEKPINSRVIFNSDGSKIATNNRLGQIAVWILPADSRWHQNQSKSKPDVASHK